jgi:hypothetical protein
MNHPSSILTPSNVIPMVIDSSRRGERAYDIYSLLLKERIVFLGTPINDQVANLIVAQLLYLNGEDPTQPINMYINSPGGSIYAGLAIYDTMQMITAPVSTYAVGVTASMGTVLLCRAPRANAMRCPTPPFTCTRPAAAPRATPKMYASPSASRNACRRSSSTWSASTPATTGKRSRKNSCAIAT